MRRVLNTHAVVDSSGWRPGRVPSLPLQQREGNHVTHMPRLASALIAGALVLGLTVGGSTTASAAQPGSAGNWLEKQLTKGLIHNDVFGFDDYGLTADTGIALAAVGGHHRAVAQIKRALARHVDSWTTGADFGSDDIYAGSVA